MLIVVILILVLALIFGLLNVVFLVLPRQFLKKRQDSKNAERQAFAASQGWQFAPYAPELLSRWHTRPFTLRGDRRVAFGVISGTANGVQFTTFDFQLRTVRRTTGGVVASEDNEVHTVWAIHLPVRLPSVDVSRRGFFSSQQANEVQTANPQFSRDYSVHSQNPGFAAELLTPATMNLIGQHKLDGWTIQGSDLLFTQRKHFSRTTPQELMQTVDMLRTLISTFPQHIWQRQN